MNIASLRKPSMIKIEKETSLSNESGGHKVNLVSKLPLVFKCPFCKLLMRNAVQTYRGERACYTCYFEAKGNKNVCPIDKEPITDERIFLDKHAIREILQLPCYCPNQKNGCDWQQVVNEVESHLPECLYAYVNCHLCGSIVIRNDLKEHVNNDCAFRLLECSYCKESFQAQCMKEHQSSCLRKPVDCPYMCGIKVEMNSLYDHVVSCDKFAAGAVCPYQLVGCIYQPDSPEDLNQHLLTSITVHAALSVSVVKYLNESNEKMKEELLSEQTLRYELEKRLEIENNDRKNLLEGLHTIQGQVEVAQNEYDVVKENFVKVERKLSEDSKELISGTESKRILEINSKLEELGSKYNNVEAKLKSHPNGVSGNASETSELIKSITRLDDVEKQSAVLAADFSDLQLKLQLMENTCYNGRQIWKIDNVEFRMRQAVTGKVTALHSAPCFQKRGGYKFCSRLYLNGDGIGKDSHISLFFVLMKSEFDVLLQWPFCERVSFKLINPNNKDDCVHETFISDKNSSSFKRPTKEMNIAAGCPLFLRKCNLGKYIVDDCLFIETSISPK